MNNAPSDFDPVEERADSFLERYRRGERPSLSEYAEQHPEMAEPIRELFPALLAMEELGAAADSARATTKIAASGLPRKLGEYCLLREIGRGGMGVVYEAVQESLGRHVALKVLPFHGLLDPMRLERFRREARAAARLHHSNIVPVFGIGEHEGIHYYTMQFIHGRGLDEVLQDVKRLRAYQPAASRFHAAKGSVPGESPAASVAEGLLSGNLVSTLEAGPDKAKTEFSSASQSGLTSQSKTEYFRSVAQIGVQVAEALEYAHGEGVLHRDVKPSNLLLDTSGRVWVTDFGLAKADEGKDLTDFGDLVGTLRYMAPERLQGKADARSDVYALGITLYEFAALQPAFTDSQRARLIEKVAHEEPCRPRKLDPRIPRDLETIVLKAVAKDPRGRYASAHALADDLRRFLADRPIHARRTPLGERLWRCCRRNPLMAALTCSVAVMSLAVVIVSVAWVLQLRRDRDHAQRLRADAVNAERDGREKLWQARLAQAQAGQRTPLAGHRFGGLAALADAAEVVRGLQPPDMETRLLTLRNEAIACLALVDVRVLSQWQAETPWGFNVAFDAGLDRYAYSDATGTVRIRQVADHREVAHLPAPTWPAQQLGLLFSPDGRWLATKHYGESRLQCEVWDLSAREPVRAVALEPNEAFLDFSPDSRYVALWRSDHSIRLHDLIAGGERRLSAAPGDTRIAFRPDSRQLAFTVPDWDHPTVHIVDIETGSERASFVHNTRIDTLAWGDRGRLLAAGCGDDGKVYVWDMPGRRLQSVLEGHQGMVTTLAFHPAGDLLASSSFQDGTTRLWDPLSGRHLVSAAGCCIHFSPDGCRLAFHDAGRIGIWEVADGKECRLLHPGRVGNRAPWHAGLENLDFSQDGELLASAEEDGIRLWDSTGQEIAYLRTGRHETVLFQPKLSPDETTLLTYGRTGLHGWPIRPEPGGRAGRLRVGPPRRFDVPANNQDFLRAACSRDGRVIAANDDAGRQIIILREEAPDGRLVIGNCPRLWSLALSPDGRWVAAGVFGQRGAGVQIWETSNGRVVRRLPGSIDEIVGGSVAFSPDGRWLVVGRQSDYHLWQTDSWEAGPVFARDNAEVQMGFAAFSSDGRLLALPHSRQSLKLIDLAARRELASLSAPDIAFPIAGHLSFSPEGSRLAAITEPHGIRIWDLDAIRRRLRQIGLDWGTHAPVAGVPPAESRSPAVIFHRTMEAENLAITDQKDCRCEVQDMMFWGRANWSNGHQLLCSCQKGGYVELAFPVPTANRYQLELYFTKAPNFGIVETAVDGKVMGKPFDGFSSGVVRSDMVKLGPIDLLQGDHHLRITAVDRNRQSTDFNIGIDCVELLPVE